MKPKGDPYWKDMAALVLVIVTASLLVIGPLTFLFMQPYFEARAFNKFTTGPKATYWDAVWTELRVIPTTERRTEP